MDTLYGDIDRKINLIKKIGSGGTSKVYLANLVENPSVVYAVKIIKSSSSSDMKFFLNEINVLKKINHPNIVRLVDGGEGVLTKENGKKSVVQYLVLELVKFGELFDFIFFPGKGFGEDIGRYLIHQLLDGLESCHKAGIVHRDMKTENIMLADDWRIKIADFGFATNSEGKKGNGVLYTALGTASYASPELLQKKPYDGVKSDIFSLGVSLFVLVTGKMPFKHALVDDPYYKEIAKNNAPKYWEKLATKVPEVSLNFQDLFAKLIAYDPNSRPTIQEIRDHQWIKNIKIDFAVVEEEFKARSKIVAQKKEIERKKEEEQEKQEKAKNQNNNKFNVYRGENEVAEEATPEDFEIREILEEDSINPYSLFIKGEANPGEILDELTLKIRKNEILSVKKHDNKYKIIIQVKQPKVEDLVEIGGDILLDEVNVQAEIKRNQDNLVLEFSRIDGNKYDFHRVFNEIKSLIEN